ncbi:MAG: arginase family protein, partial [Nonomuraea sp.]|nr:arginase family protein [Nonomuraea sp.]
MTTVIEVPQWQASGSPTARRLAAGARLLADLVPGADRVTIDIADDLATTASRVRQALPPAGFVVTVGGDCGVELEPVAAARRKYGEGLVVVWFDAHADLNTPASSPSGAFHGMVLRALTGEGFPDLVPDTHLDPRRIVLAGVRALDPAEQSFITTAAIPHAPTEQSVIASAAMPADP